MPKIFIITPVVVHAELWNVVGRATVQGNQAPCLRQSGDRELGTVVWGDGNGSGPSVLSSQSSVHIPKEREVLD